MLDKNNVEIRTGDIVKIEGSFFKVDNGLYYVDNAPGNPTWCGSDLSLHKIRRNGELSIAKNSIAFWPLKAFTNNREKNAMANEWNKEQATIEVIEGIPTEHIQKYFTERAEQTQKQADYQKWNWGEESEYYKKLLDMAGHYKEVVNYIKAKEQTTEQQPEVVEDTTEQPEAEQTEPQTIKRKYFPINETLARQAKGMWSFSEYTPNSTTNSYKAEVNKAYKIVEKIAERKPQRLNEALEVAERYSRKYAEWINKSNSIEMQCPSVMICGAGNFPVRKKEKQNAARDKHMKDYEYVNGYLNKLENLLHGKEIIKSHDKDAVEKLQEKVDDLKNLQQTMKDANAYYKKKNTLEGFEMKEELKEDCYRMIESGWSDRPFPSYRLTNNNAKIKNTQNRLDRLTKAKATPTQEVIENDICKVVENTEAMRIQLIFDGKPSEQIRNILKSNGFRWAPSQGAWQRQLTSNARYATKRVIEQLENIA